MKPIEIIRTCGRCKHGREFITDIGMRVMCVGPIPPQMPIAYMELIANYHLVPSFLDFETVDELFHAVNKAPPIDGNRYGAPNEPVVCPVWEGR